MQIVLKINPSNIVVYEGHVIKARLTSRATARSAYVLEYVYIRPWQCLCRCLMLLLVGGVECSELGLVYRAINEIVVPLINPYIYSKYT